MDPEASFRFRFHPKRMGSQFGDCNLVVRSPCKRHGRHYKNI